LDTNPEIKYTIKILLLPRQRYKILEVREITNIYDKIIIKRIHKFNYNHAERLFTKIAYCPMVKINNDSRKQILKIPSTNPMDLGLKFPTRYRISLAGYLTGDQNIIKQARNQS
jgi:hypothetical protein